MSLIIDFLFNPVVIASFLFLFAVLLIYIKVANVNITEKTIETGKRVLIHRLKKDELNYLKSKQMDLLGLSQQGFGKQYRDLVQNVLISLKLTMFKVENFTTFLILLAFIVATVFSFFFESILLGSLIAFPTVAAVVATLAAFTRTSVRMNDNRVMDALDLICPTIETSVNSAIEKNLDGIDPKIRWKFKAALDNQDARNMFFKDAMHRLGEELGPRSADFIEKSIIYYDTGDEGMEEIFMDVVEINNTIRTINEKADMIFKEQNFQLIASLGIIYGFLIFAYASPLTGEFLRTTFLGKLVAVVCISFGIVDYAVIQIMQMTINYDKLKG